VPRSQARLSLSLRSGAVICMCAMRWLLGIAILAGGSGEIYAAAPFPVDSGRTREQP